MKTIRGALYVSLVVLMILPACSSSRSGGTIQDKGKEIELTTRDYSLKGDKGTLVEDTFVVIAAESSQAFPDSMRFLDGNITIIPKKVVDELKKHYGTISDIQSNGYRLAMKSALHLRVMAVDGSTQKRIKKLADLNARNQYPLVKITMNELLIMRFLYKNSPVLLWGDAAKQSLVSKIKILDKNYPL